ncbi:TetR/AcrR family transcriptional regulator [Mycobacterium simiae]|uniref:TetR/AcrR family transcriptional regulator n=1 Tax=Mycobacterium simiae TaxID=1784 RepID=UPI0026309B7C|nr:TetR/AcrR family transcriptional regulator [Mycobacterium simiae]
MARADWLVGGDRRALATERIYAAATEMLTRESFERFDIDALAKRVHCSRATVYRYAGGKAEIRDAVITRAASRIVETVRTTVANLSGAQRVVTAITVALKLIRADPLYHLMISPVRVDEMAWLTESPLLSEFATDLTGLTDGDSQAAHWVVRIVLSLMSWPVGDDEVEYQLVQRFVAPAFTDSG